MYYINACKRVYQFPSSNKCDDPQGARFSKLVLYISMIGQFGFAE